MSTQAQMRAKLNKFKSNKAFAKRSAKQVKAAKTHVAKALQKAVAKSHSKSTYQPSFDALFGLDDLLKEGEALLQQKPRPSAQTQQANKMEFAFQSGALQEQERQLSPAPPATAAGQQL